MNFNPYEFNCLQIGDNDLIGNKFNGHDLRFYLRENKIETSHIVNRKESNDENTFIYDFNSLNFTEAIIKNKLFLEADILHLHLIHNTMFDIKYLPVITKLKPTVISLHDPFFLGGHCIHHFDCEKWKTHCYDCEYLDKPFIIENDDTALRFAIKKEVIQNSDITAIVASRWMEEKIEQSPIWANKKIYKVPFGIDQSLFKPKDIKQAKKELGIDETSITFMLRSDPSPYKGLDILKEAFKNIKTKNKSTLITVGNKSLLEEFKSIFNIIEYDWIKDDNLMAKLYQASDIFLMPSTQETFGMMAIEAMSSGKMVLALEGTALPDVINSPKCGFAVAKADFTKTLQYLIDNPNELLERGEKSLKYAKENYNKDIYVKRIIEIYKEVIKPNKSNGYTDLILTQLIKHNKEVVKPHKSNGYTDLILTQSIKNNNEYIGKVKTDKNESKMYNYESRTNKDKLHLTKKMLDIKIFKIERNYRFVILTFFFFIRLSIKIGAQNS